MAQPPKKPPVSSGAKSPNPHNEAIQSEVEKVGAKIDAAYQKLASKLRRKADKAKADMEAKKSASKRAVLMRRFEMYDDAALLLETRLKERGMTGEGNSD